MMVVGVLISPPRRQLACCRYVWNLQNWLKMDWPTPGPKTASEDRDARERVLRKVMVDMILLLCRAVRRMVYLCRELLASMEVEVLVFWETCQ